MLKSGTSDRDEKIGALGYSALVERLSKFPAIIVTGPHRSGTTFATEALGQDLGYMVVREEHFGFKGFRKLMWILFWTRVARLRIVVQAPALFHRVPLIARFPRTAIVVIHRPLDQISRSWEHTYAKDGRLLSGDSNNARELKDLGYSTGNAAEIKYQLWSQWKSSMKNAFDIEYLSFQSHPLWVNAETRRKLGAAWGNRRIA